MSFSKSTLHERLHCRRSRSALSMYNSQMAQSRSRCESLLWLPRSFVARQRHSQRRQRRALRPICPFHDNEQKLAQKARRCSRIIGSSAQDRAEQVEEDYFQAYILYFRDCSGLLHNSSATSSRRIQMLPRREATAYLANDEPPLSTTPPTQQPLTFYPTSDPWPYRPP